MLYWILRNPDCPMGGSCVGGVCRDERGDVQNKPLEEDEERERRKHHRERDVVRRDGAARRDGNEPAERTDEPYACDPGATVRWCMNLDSTLEQKDYR